MGAKIQFLFFKKGTVWLFICAIMGVNNSI